MDDGIAMIRMAKVQSMNSLGTIEKVKQLIIDFTRKYSIAIGRRLATTVSNRNGRVGVTWFSNRNIKHPSNTDLPMITTLPLKRIFAVSPSHQLLPQIFETWSRKAFGEDISQLFQGCDFHQFDFEFLHQFSKPNRFQMIMFAPRSKWWRKSIREDEHACVILVNRDV